MQSRDDDKATPKAIIDAAYALISGRTAEERDWERWRSLHAPGARLIPIEKNDAGERVPRVLTPEQFIESRSAFFTKNDFFEYETAREERRCGSVAQVWSSYDAVSRPGGAPIRRGVNSFQLWHDGARWWILSVAWDAVEALEAVSR
jgi:hypothetical protein